MVPRSRIGQSTSSAIVKKLLCQSLAVIALASGEAARAADSSATWYTKAPVKSDTTSPSTPASDWTGFYVGAHAGVASGYSAWSATQPGGAPNLAGSLEFFRAFDVFDGSGSHFGGLTAGYNYMLPSRVVIGVEADVSFASTLDAGQSFTSPVVGAATYGDTVELFGTVRGRIGYDVNHWLYYATGGLAWTYDQFNRTTIAAGLAAGAPAGTVEAVFAGRVGWTVGGGVVSARRTELHV
jgi:high affinity Mn2+ porin